MDLYKIILNIIFFVLAKGLTIENSEDFYNTTVDIKKIERSPDNVFNGVYSECFLHLSYACLQKKTLLYLKELNNLNEVSVLGDYIKFVKINTTIFPDQEDSTTGSTDELAFMIDKAVDDFFDNHVLKFNALGRDISIPRNMEEFVGRKKRKGGGGGMMGGHGGGHDDGGKKKMMMMAMMCMKMKLMMMIPTMMGMMGMMSFKGMMFSMMSFMLSKMMLLMKILEKKGGAGGLGGGGGGLGADGGWAAGGTGGGAWMPAGGADFGGGSGGGGGGYDANGQWQSRSIAESLDILNKPIVYYRNFNDEDIDKQKTDFHSSKVQGTIKHNNNKLPYKSDIRVHDFGKMPEVSYRQSVVRLNNKDESEIFKKPVLVYKKSNVAFRNYLQDTDNVIDIIKNKVEQHSSDTHSRTRRDIIKGKEQINFSGNYITKSENENGFELKSRRNKNILRKKRSILDLLQNSYTYWMNRILGLNNNRRTNFQKYKILNGVKYVYYPFKAQRPKMSKEVHLTSTVKVADELKPIVTAEDFNKGEIMEGAIESRMNRKKFHKMKDTLNDTMEDNPWE